jgi:hypothetical protein
LFSREASTLYHCAIIMTFVQKVTLLDIANRADRWLHLYGVHHTDLPESGPWKISGFIALPVFSSCLVVVVVVLPAADAVPKFCSDLDDDDDDECAGAVVSDDNAILL